MRKSLFFVFCFCNMMLSSQTFNYSRTIALPGSPKGLCVKSNGEIFVALASLHKIVKMDLGGNVLLTLGSTAGAGQTQFNSPNDVDVDASGNIYVADRGNMRVQVFDALGNFLRSQAFTTSVNGVTISPDGHLYVALMTEIKIFNGANEGGSIITLSKDKFREVRKVYFDSEGKIFIVDKNTGVIKLSAISGTQGVVDLLIKKNTSSVSAYNRLSYLTITSRGNLVVTSDENNAAPSFSEMGLYRFSPTGVFIDNIGQLNTGTDPNRFNAPYGIAVGQNDSIYVADFGNNAIKVWAAQDAIAPISTSVSITNITRASVDFALKVNEPAVVKWIIQDALLPTPSVTDLLSGSNSFDMLKADVLKKFTIQSINSSALKLYYVLTDQFGNNSDVLSGGTFNTNIPLTITNIFSTEKIGESIIVEYNANDKGDLFWTTREYSALNPTPSASEIEAGTSAFASGSISYLKPGKGDQLKISIPAFSRYTLFSVLKNGSEYSNVASCVVAPYSDLDKIYDRTMDLLRGESSVDYANPQVHQRYLALKSIISQAHQKVGAYDPSAVLAPFDLSGTAQTTDIALVKDLVGNVLFPLALSYQLKGPENEPNADFKSESTLSEIMRLYDYLEAREFKKNCSLSFTGGGVYLGLTGYFYANLLMKEELQRSGKIGAVSEMMDWATRWVIPGDTEWAADVQHNESRSDGIRTLFNNRLLSLLCLTDFSVDREGKMSYLKQVIDRNLEISTAWDGFLKSDFTGYHHRGICGNSYITEALHVASQMSMLLQGTSYALNEASNENLAKGLLAYRSYSAKYDIPRGICMRFPSQLNALYKHIPAFAYLYETLSGDLQKEVGDAFSGLYDSGYSQVQKNMIQDVTCGINFMGGLGTIQKANRLKTAIGLVQSDMEINKVFPHGAMQVHRKADWMASVKGYSKYVWDFESNSEQNWFGRNQSAGELSLYTKKDSEGIVTAEASGVGYNGLDWSHVPGTTTFNMPLSDILAEAKNFQWAKFSPEFYAGGVSDGKNGLFSFKYSDIRQAYDYANGRKWLGVQLSANKSYFFFGDFIIALGSGINNKHLTYDAHTTIFQNILSDVAIPTTFNGISKSGLGFSYDQTTSETACLTDVAGNGFYIPSAKGLHLQRSEQISQQDRTLAETRGNYATAWINHGKAVNEKYEYVVWIRGAANIEAIKENPRSYYTVQRQDDVAHIVKFQQTNQKGYAVFKENCDIVDEFIKQVSQPCMALISKTNENDFNITLSNPELGYYAKDKFPYQVWSIDNGSIFAQSTTQPVEVQLKGKYEIESPNSKAELLEYELTNNISTVRFNGMNSESITLTMVNKSIVNGIGQNESEEFMVFPTFTQGEIKIKFQQALTRNEMFRVTDVTGRDVCSGIINAGVALKILNLSFLNNGNYFIRVQNTVHKIVICH